MASISIEKQIQKFKIIVIGDSGVGKTCLTYRFCEGKFPHRPEATVGFDFRQKEVEVGGEIVKLCIWDTAGQDRFRSGMGHHYYRNVHGVVFVYDVTKLDSFKHLSHWIEEYTSYNLSPNVPKILVGNKCDCQEIIQVQTYMAQRFADLHGMPLFETSAIDDSDSDHVEAIFMTLALKLKNSDSFMLWQKPKDVADTIILDRTTSVDDNSGFWCCN